MMLKQLVKKQMLEMFRSFFIDNKKNQERSKRSTISFIIGYVFLIGGVLGGMFTYLAFSLCEPLASQGVEWLYFAFISMIAMALGIFGSVFNTYSGLYLAKDNDLLLSMPIPVRYIMISRLLSVYLMALLYSSIVMIPAVAVYLARVSSSLQSIIGGILLLFCVTMIVTVLSCLLGWVVAKISAKLKNKTFITVLVSLAFFAAYYFVYFKANTIINSVIANAQDYAEKIKGSAYPIYIFGRVGTGDALPCVVLVAFVALLAFLTYSLLDRSFLKIATTSQKTARVKYTEKKARVRSADGALLYKEMRRFFSSPNYILNCGFGMLVLVIAGAVILFRGESLMRTLYGIFDGNSTGSAVVFASLVCLLTSTNNMSAPSVSLEGKMIWISQSLPVTAWQVLRAKFNFHFILTSIPCVTCCACVAAVLKADILTTLFVFLLPLMFVAFFDLFGLFLNLKSPNLNWTNEVIPIKQGLSAFGTILGGWAFGAIIMTVYLPLHELVSEMVYLASATAFVAILDLALFSWLRRKGAKIYSEL